MDEKTILITEDDGTYRIEKNSISDFALIGLLECILFDLKSAGSRSSDISQSATAEKSAADDRKIEKPIEQSQTLREAEDAGEADSSENPKETAAAAANGEAPQTSAAPDLRIRIGNAVKAIRALGARIEDADLSALSEAELQSELEELTAQYKRLKSSKGKNNQ